MVTKENYYSVISKVNKQKLPPELKASADFVDDVTNNGKDWSIYDEDAVIRKTIDQFFSLLEKEVEPKSVVPRVSSKPKEEKRVVAKTENSKTVKNKPSSLRIVKRKGQEVERISDEIMFIRTYLKWDNKSKNIDTVRRFIRSLQRSIKELRMRDSSRFAVDIMSLQDDVIKLYNSMRNSKSYERIVRITEEKKAHLQFISGKQELMHSIKHIKSYINLQGKEITNQQAKLLHNRIGKEVNSNTITVKDPYWNELEEILSELKVFVQKNPNKGILSISSRQLNGLNGILSGIEVSSLNGIPETISAPKNMMMNSMDFIKMEFESIGFTGEWFEFIGDPSRGFLILVYGQPKFGKSILCIRFANYLADNFGKVLYIIREEGYTKKLKDKLINDAHPNITLSDYLPDSFEGFDFVFFDSINRLNITSETLLELKEQNPEVSFVAISQVTKAGKARGSQELLHDVDSIIEVPEKGKAIQYGRFNQGGELDIFQ